MKRFSLTQLLLFVTWCGIACFALSQYLATAPYRGMTRDIKNSEYTHYGVNEQIVTAIDEELVRESPSWNPTKANPPVSARAALSIADELRRKRLRDAGGWQWGLESLTLYPLDGTNSKWCWCVLFTAYPTSGGFSGVPPELSVYILMDGKVIPQEVSPQNPLYVVDPEEASEEEPDK